VRIFLYAVTQHLLTRKNILFLNDLKGFQGSLAEISQYFHFVDNSYHLKDLVICILWTLVMSLFDTQAMILTVILLLPEQVLMGKWPVLLVKNFLSVFVTIRMVGRSYNGRR
jgi:hypothetical protein